MNFTSNRPGQRDTALGAGRAAAVVRRVFSGGVVAGAVVSLFALPAPASALIVTGKSIEVLELEGFTYDVLQLAKSPGYIGWWEGPPFGGGNYNLEFEGDEVALGDFMTSFSKLAVSSEVTFTTAPLTTRHFVNRESMRGPRGTYAHWTLTLWTQFGWEKQLKMREDARVPEARPRKNAMVTWKAPAPAVKIYILPPEE